MKTLLLLIVCSVCLSGECVARANDDGCAVTSEEVRLLAAFRANPEPFRRVLYGSRQAADLRGSVAVLGPRDIIDVTVSDGKIAFYGRRREYAPASIRLTRGETGFLIFGREGSSNESRVQVAFLTDGLHFDVRESGASTSVPSRGFLVIPESHEWRSGEPIRWTGRLDDPSSVSLAENITFRVRYVLR